MRYAALVEYDGSVFKGMQLQPDFLTVQGEIERALGIFLRQTIRIHFAGRTDAGVHAVCQVIHFDCLEISDIRTMVHSVNCIMNRAVALTHLEKVAHDFHSRFKCRGREYIYLVYNSEKRQPLYNQRALWIRHELNIDEMRKAAECLIGENDFASFTKGVYSRSGEKTVRRINYIRIAQENQLIAIHFSGSGFLHNMIRIITGTLLQIGSGKIPVTAMTEILEKRDRAQAGKTLSPDGLYFFRACYDDFPSEKYTINFPYGNFNFLDV